MTKSVKKFVILLVALLMCATVVFAACSNENFTAVSVPDKATPESNGGIAVVYGEWLYYVNGYTADVTADNTYSDDVLDAPRIGSVVRIRIAEIETILAINDDKDLTSSQRSEKIAKAIRGDSEVCEELKIKGAQTVIPKIYYSGNTTTTQFTGIYIFNDRIYVTTPSDELTANGDPKTSELTLMSFNLGGGDRKEHYTFTNNAAQIWFKQVGDKLYATYLMDSVLHTLDVASGKDTVVTHKYGKLSHINDTVSSVNWDNIEGKEAVFFIDEFGSICKLEVGKTEYTVIVENDTFKEHGDHIESGKTTYTIKFVNDGVVYYTVATGKDASTDDLELLYATDADHKDKSALPTTSVSVTAWKEDAFIITDSFKSDDRTYYSICVVEPAGEDSEELYKITPLLPYGKHDSSITINKIEGDLLYYTFDNVSYVIDLSGYAQLEPGQFVEGEARAKSLPSTTGWAAPDFINIQTADGVLHYIISASTDSVTLTKFNPSDLKANTVSIALTLTPVPVEE